MDGSSHKDVLTNNQVRLVRELDLDKFSHLLEPCLGRFFVDPIASMENKIDKTRKLLENLKIGPREKFEDFCKIIAGIDPSLFELLKDRQPTRDESNFYMQPFIDGLHESILNTGNKPDSVIDQPIDLDTQFVTLRLSDGQRVTQMDDEQRDDYTLPDIYQMNLENLQGCDLSIDEILPQHSPGSSTLIKGRAGVGKTTLIQYLIRKWARREWAASYTCTFLLNLRKLVHINHKMTLTELLGMYAEYVVDNPNLNEVQPSVEWLINNAQDILFFMDGIDELPKLTTLLPKDP